VDLGNILYQKAPVQDGGFECACEVYEAENSVGAVEYVREVEVSMAIARLMESLYESCESGDEISFQFQIFGCWRVVEPIGQSSFEGFGVGDFFGDYEASFFEEGAPLPAVGNDFWGAHARGRQLAYRINLTGGATDSAAMREPVCELDEDWRLVVAF
jgi:hypothetical protein